MHTLGRCNCKADVNQMCMPLQVGPYAVPKGTQVHISAYTMHHDPKWWQDAEEFKPERWVGDETGGDRSGGLAYMPFGLGPRMCIGIKFAGITEIPLVLSS